jgi:hypothetical protein
MNNPFEFGRELGTDELVDRADLVAAIVQTIRQGSKLFLIRSLVPSYRYQVRQNKTCLQPSL